MCLLKVQKVVMRCFCSNGAPVSRGEARFEFEIRIDEVLANAAVVAVPVNWSDYGERGSEECKSPF